jgi:excisionase family DNA binding protein
MSHAAIHFTVSRFQQCVRENSAGHDLTGVVAMQKILTITEVADRLGMHPVSVYRLVKEAKLPVFRIGRMLRFDAEELEKWMLNANLPRRRKRRPRPLQSTSNGTSHSRKRSV